MSSFAISPATQLYGLENVLYSLPMLLLFGGISRLGMLLGVVLLLFSPLIVPALLVHAAYYRRNRHLRVATFADRLELTTPAGARLVLPYREIEAVELNAAGGIYRKPAWDKFTFQSYHYLKICCHGQTHYLTSLLAKHPLEKAFPQLLEATANRYTRRKRLIAYLE